MAEQVVISVRGEAERTVAPDFVVLHCGMSTRAASKVDALGQLRVAQQALVESLAGLGAVPLTVETRRAALTWSLGSIGTHDEHDLDKATGRHGPTGWIVANAAAQITSRMLGRISALGAALASVRNVHIDGVRWDVDPDNEQWRGVRSDAIDAAIAKGRDYAAALGGSVTRVDQVADAGLLPAGAGESFARTFGASGALLSSAGEGTPDLATLDPVPQVIRAVVEARFTADLGLLSADNR